MITITYTYNTITRHDSRDLEKQLTTALNTLQSRNFICSYNINYLFSEGLTDGTFEANVEVSIDIYKTKALTINSLLDALEYVIAAKTHVKNICNFL